MIGQRIESRRPFAWFATLLLLTAGLFVFLAIQFSNGNWMIAALMPGAVGSALLAARPPKFVGFFRDEGLEVERKGVSKLIPYEAIERVWVHRRKLDPAIDGPRNYEIVIGHSEWCQERIPKGLSMPADDIYRFLIDRTPIGGSDDVHEDLIQYHRDHTGAFGSDRVWSYRATKHKIGPKYMRLRMASLAIVVVGAAWITIGITGRLESGSAWIGTGCGTIFYGLLMFAASYSSGRQHKFKGWQEASLVISPMGLALVQGDVRGEMKWDELHDVKLGNPKSFTSFTLTSSHAAASGLVLKVEGADIVVPDIYDRPLVAIHQAIRLYWR